MESIRGFQDYDAEEVYRNAQDQAIDPATSNFVVEFSPTESIIAFNLSAESIDQVCNRSRSGKGRVRWINLWSPHTQKDVVEVLARHYGFPASLTSAMCSAPPKAWEMDLGNEGHFGDRILPRDDEELERPSAQIITNHLPEDDNHYVIANDMINYQSLEVGPNFMCVGANFMHSVPRRFSNDEALERLWSWIILGDDGMIITLQEQRRQFGSGRAYAMAIRGHTMSMLSQLSKQGCTKSGSVSIASLRHRIDSEDSYESNAASDFFYYFFDHWHTTYISLIAIQGKIDNLSQLIISRIAGRWDSEVNRRQIVQLLFAIGKQLRLNRQLHEGYEGLIDSIFKSSSESRNNALLSIKARQRFDRLQTRLKRLIAGSIREMDKEKDNLVETYFNMIAQNDSKATAITSRAVTLIAKLAVLFLPLILMTSYFSVTIADLQGVYTVTTYWATFGVVIGLCLLALLFIDYGGDYFFAAMFVRAQLQLRRFWDYLAGKPAHPYKKNEQQNSRTKGNGSTDAIEGLV